MTTDHRTAEALLGVEDCIDQYIAECRGRVDGFVQRHFSLQETIALQRQSFVSDLLCYPVNALWAIPHLFLKKLIEVPEKLGWRIGGELVATLPAGLKTRYQKEIERLIAEELLAWPRSAARGPAVPGALRERFERHAQVAPLFASGALSDRALAPFSEISKLIEAHSASRALVLDTAATVLTLATGWLVFGDHSLGLSGMSDRLAGKMARDKAASHFVLGAGLGSAFYSIFPPKPSVGQVVVATVMIGFFITGTSLVVGMLSDPCLKRIGLQQARLHALIDAIEDHLYRQLRKQLKPAIKQLAA